MDKKAKKITMLVNYAYLFNFLAWAMCFALPTPALPTGYSLTQNDKEPVMNEVIIDESYNGKKIEVFSNSRVVLRLPENPSTGYRWVFKPINDNIINLKKDFYQPSTEMVLGAWGTRIFDFMAQSPGTVQLSLNYKRPWESENTKTKIFIITVQVLVAKPK